VRILNTNDDEGNTYEKSHGPDDADGETLQFSTGQVADVSVEDVVELERVLDMCQAIHLVLRAQQLADDAFKTLRGNDEDANGAHTTRL
jgi:hypothetical protein